ncbi:hypothetical protein [Parasitella parasitica]|uniref:Smr domain-containing protein n=1 Tax=Parasitella parasitica TaxID=35722 RepID=A0A0B7NAK7_9FUNG|nr:hypothetical protein [Parasitella parasitica]
MGRLQDNQYSALQQSTRKRRSTAKQNQARDKDESKLQATFCPPLDPSLIQAIWNDSFNYATCFEILSSLAKEADQTLDQQDVLASMEQLDLGNETKTIITTTTDTTTESEDENINFLFTCFPTFPLQDLVDALESQDNDVEKATDVLLNREFIQQVEHQNDIVESAEKNGMKAASTTKKRVKPRPRKSTVWTSGQLPSVGISQGHTSNPAAQSQNMREIIAQEEEDAYTDIATMPFNMWHQYDPTINNLEHYFPRVPKSTIAACVQHCRGNIIASVKSIMEKHPEEKPEHELTWSLVKDLNHVKQELEAIMVDRTLDDIARVALGVVISCKDSNKSLDQMVQMGIEHFLSFDVNQLALEARLQKMAKESDIIRAKQKKQDMPVIPEYLLLNNQRDYIEDDPEECRDIAMQLIIERNTLFRKAAAAYQHAKNKGPGEGGIAFFYSDNARQLDSRAKDWNMRAARATVRGHRLRQNDDHLLDLHGLTVVEAQAVVREGVNQWYSRSQMQSSRRQLRPLKIITGVGKHSKYGESKLLPSTLKILKQEGWLFDMPNPGCIFVKGAKPTNMAIEEGEQFKARSDKDVYVTSRLDIKLPPQVDDLIPLNTRLSTTPTVLSEKPQWRTTLIYYISHQILSRLKNSQATLDIISISEDCKQEKLGSVTLSMQDAKSVLMRKGGRDMSQIQQFVVDKGDWIPIRGTATGKIKAGLFIVEMPYSTESNVSGNKEFGTPLQIPVRSNHSNKSNMGELGLEICSDMSDLFINLNGDDDPEQQEESILDYQESDDGIEQEEEDFITIGSGTDKIGFLFRIIQAKHISSILNQYSDIEEAYFYYHFGKREYQCLVEQGHDNWRAIEYHSNVLLQGSLQDIKDWLSEQNSMEVFLVVKQLNQSEDIIIGKSEVFLKSRDIGISQQSVIIYDTDKSWHINQEKQFAQMQLQIGLTRGWETIEDIGNISKQIYRYTSQDFTFDNENEVF